MLQTEKAILIFVLTVFFIVSCSGGDDARLVDVKAVMKRSGKMGMRGIMCSTTIVFDKYPEGINLKNAGGFEHERFYGWNWIANNYRQ